MANSYTKRKMCLSTSQLKPSNSFSISFFCSRDIGPRHQLWDTLYNNHTESTAFVPDQNRTTYSCFELVSSHQCPQRTARAVQTIAYNSHKWVNIPILKVWDDGYFETH
ncbi:hypothetical protein NQ317_009572 [Molorchus minor]|uniref:Uncharacterized protein n=1 Tax=Molorchus minor TaxID=1323400 RepID=A0ABQ9J0S2_9CUCU|nr:hypothetical protein NQ317_009572 [Molorchus minor]